MINLENIKQCDLCGSKKIKNIDKIGNANKCLECGYIYISPRPFQKDIIEFYSKESQYNNWLNEIEARNDMWNRRLNLLLKYRNKGKLLDIGAGIGQFLHIAKKYFDVYGTEPSEEGRKLSKKLFNLDIDSEIKFDKEYDLVTLYHVLEHVPSPTSTIQECKKLLKQNGLLAIAIPNSNLFKNNSTPCDDFVKYLFKKPSSRFPEIIFKSRDEIHLSYFKSKALCNLLRNNGFRIIDNTIDPFKPVMSISDNVEYKLAKNIMKIFKYNVYDTILIIAEKI